MIGKEDLNNEEQTAVKVTDKRKFNLDGSVREGVELETKKPKPEDVPIYEPSEETVETYNSASVEKKVQAEAEAEITEEDFDPENFPGADDPASFINFMTTLASQSAAALGAMPNPATGQRTVDLETGKYWIDVLAMLGEKTENNLLPQEAKLLEGILGDLRMQYVQLVRMTEEKLKAQAAQKFSANDILGKK
ncbi:MAG: DUF1844 domain-containing protein [Acidobacteriota bacterium]